MIAAIFITLFFLIAFVAQGVMGYLLWAMQKKLESQALKLAALSEKVKDGEDIIIKNFEEVEKRFLKLQHDIKETKQSSRLKAQEVAKAAARIERSRESEQA